MTKIQRHAIRRTVQKQQEKEILETIKIIPYVLAGYSLLWL
jgi:hypothetical protein